MFLNKKGDIILKKLTKKIMVISVFILLAILLIFWQNIEEKLNLSEKSIGNIILVLFLFLIFFSIFYFSNEKNRKKSIKILSRIDKEINKEIYARQVRIEKLPERFKIYGQEESLFYLSITKEGKIKEREYYQNKYSSRKMKYRTIVSKIKLEIGSMFHEEFEKEFEQLIRNDNSQDPKGWVKFIDLLEWGLDFAKLHPIPIKSKSINKELEQVDKVKQREEELLLARKKTKENSFKAFEKRKNV